MLEVLSLFGLLGLLRLLGLAYYSQAVRNGGVAHLRHLT